MCFNICSLRKPRPEVTRVGFSALCRSYKATTGDVPPVKPQIARFHVAAGVKRQRSL